MEKLALPTNSPMMKKRFLFGVATSSYQIEGDIENRLPCIWDTFCASNGKIIDGTNGDIACEHIKRWEQDIDLIASLHVDAYRFSISWPRVIHQDGSLNETGIQFYEKLIAGLLHRGVKSYITLYHWDLPQHIEEQGGWLNRQTSTKFAQYAELIAKRLGDSVESYATFNEPFCSAFLGYEVGVHAPGITGVKNGRTAAHHILLAHGYAVQAIRRHTLHAKVGIVVNVTPCYPRTTNFEDVKATAKANGYINHWYIKPLFHGQYPDVFNDLAQNDRPNIEDGDFNTIRQPLDFIGINYYTRLTYSAPKQGDALYHEHPANSPTTDIGWEIYPKALTEILTELNNEYLLPPVYITENGAAMADKMVGEAVDDKDRIEYFQSHLLAVDAAISLGVDVRGYFAWSLMDNFEWAQGLSKRFGVIHVDYNTQKRTLKSSAHAYKSLIASRTE